MKYILILLLLLLSSPVYAIDGEIYIGAFGDSTARAYPDGGIAKYISGVEIGQKIGRFRPYLKLETIGDGYNGDGTFHPASVRYDIGMSLDVYKGLVFDVSHSCWHPVDRGGTVEQYNLFLLKYRFNR